jgi:hypothetical protein
MAGIGSAGTLHVTNGDSAVQALKAAGAHGIFLPWRDVLHDGPVPAGLSGDELAAERARWLAAQGWGDEAEIRADIVRRDAELARMDEYEEVALWFEHDLYDQLHLIQVLDAVAARMPVKTRISLIQASEYLGPAEPDRLRELWDARRELTAEQIALGRRAWAAFRSPEPTQVQGFALSDTSALPYLGPALRRHLQQFPSVRNGLSRSEQQGLEAIAAGESSVADAYLASHHQREDPIWMGDSTFVLYLLGMADGPWPLVTWADGSPITRPSQENAGEFMRRTVALTDAGRDVMEGRADRVRLNGIDRWLGGVHLSGRHAAWRWDEVAGRIVRGADPE